MKEVESLCFSKMMTIVMFTHSLYYWLVMSVLTVIISVIILTTVSVVFIDPLHV